MSLNLCVYSYVESFSSQQLCYSNARLDVEEIYNNLLKDINLNDEIKVESIQKQPIPLLHGKLAPVKWYYQLFTSEELKKSSLKHNSEFPSKCFLTFEGLDSITLGETGKILVKFIKVDKKEVDNFLKRFCK